MRENKLTHTLVCDMIACARSLLHPATAAPVVQCIMLHCSKPLASTTPATMPQNRRE